ncbi:hypothetical protein GWI33_007722 [Rhynchophorus ferrugineus]|uniref:SEA domain-containing protein n=1 Tax=Rhynchophorus ferrugineus TaxID=354439 RepID=A0A834IJR6_RHYFE|nr:hypothetical protein GWI33_007722 [Rhynchophorus ferrugineus]
MGLLLRLFTLIGLLNLFVQGQQYVARSPEEDYYRQDRGYSVPYQSSNSFQPIQQASDVPFRFHPNFPQYKHHFTQTQPDYQIGNKIVNVPTGFRSSQQYYDDPNYSGLGKLPPSETFLGQVTLNNPPELPGTPKVQTFSDNSNGSHRNSKSLGSNTKNDLLQQESPLSPKLTHAPPVPDLSKAKNSLDDKETETEGSVEEEVDDDSEYYEKNSKEENNSNDLSEDEEYLDDEEGDDEEYEDESEEYQQDAEEETTTAPMSTKSFEVLTTKPVKMMKDSNFSQFVDTSSMDTTSQIPDTSNIITQIPMTISMSSSVGVRVGNNKPPQAPKKNDFPELVVSVVTSKTIVNNTVIAPVTPVEGLLSPTEALAKQSVSDDNSTESWIVVASVQTSRSVSGARYLPFPVVEQDERIKLLNEPDETTNNSKTTSKEDEEVLSTLPELSTKMRTSTESLIDKLDRVQSDLSSGLLTGGFKNDNIAVIKENTPEKSSTTSEVTSSSTVPTSTKPYPQVNIRKYSPGNRPSTQKPKRPPVKQIKSNTPKGKMINQLVIEAPKAVVQDDISALLPPGYKPRATDGSAGLLQDIFAKLKSSEQNKATTTTTAKPEIIEDPFANIKPDDLAAFLPPGYKPPKTTAAPPTSASTPSSGISNILQKAKPVDDISALLPPGYKPPKSESGSLFEKAKPVDDISALLPPGFKVPSYKTTTSSPASGILAKAKPVDDISALLPPGYKNKPETTAKKGPDSLLQNAQPVDISAFLPPGYKASTSKSTEDVSQNIPANLLPPGYKAASVNQDIPANLLPPGFKPTEEASDSPAVSTTTASTTAGGFKVVFPSRPGGARKTSRMTTSKPVASNNANKPTLPTIQKGWPSRASTEFTGWPTPPTTPISIEKLLEAARTASTSTSTTTSSTTPSTTTTTTTTTTTPRPTTPGICSSECDLAGTIKLVGGAKWAPELLDRNTKEYQILANDVENELEHIYSSSPVLRQWYRKIRIDGFSEGSVLVDYLVELNDVGRRIDTQEIKRLFHESLMESSPKNREPKSLNESGDMANKASLGQFEVDTKFTDFVVIPKGEIPAIGYFDDNVLLPQWAIAVIVIGLASLLFVIIFGATVLVNRHKNSKKTPMPLTEDMLNDLNKSHMGGYDNYGTDDFYNMDDVWDNKAYENKLHKKRSEGSIHDNSMSNLYDSWRSEWNQNVYNGYYPNPSSQHSGYSGRRRPDYDTNF